MTIICERWMLRSGIIICPASYTVSKLSQRKVGNVLLKKHICYPGAVRSSSLATACSSKNVNEPTANESSQSASSESSSNGMDESSPMDDLKEDAKDAVLIRTELPMQNSPQWLVRSATSKTYVYDHRRRNRLWIQLRAGSEPDGLSDVKDGDKVTVTYTGTVSEVDAFSGTVLSVKKAE